MKEIKLHTTLTKKIKVEESMLASHVGSGTVDVYATPMMIALMENAAAACLEEFLDMMLLLLLEWKWKSVLKSLHRIAKKYLSILSLKTRRIQLEQPVMIAS